MNVPFTFVLNAGSGKQDVSTLQANLERLIPKERQGCIYVVRPGDDFAKTLTEAVDDCRRQDGILVAAGGDGTINAAIARVLPLKLPLGIIPLGTFNYFARAHGIPVDLEAAIQNLLDGEAVKLPVCTLNGEPFIVNVSLGLHTKIIAARERHTRLTGRNRFVAFVSALITLLKEQYTMRAKLLLDGRLLQRKATMVMISNNELQLESFNLEKPTAQENRLAVVVMHQLSKGAMLALMWRRIRGQLDESEDLELFWAREVEVLPSKPFTRVVIDGELRHFRSPLRVCLQPEAISCVLPKQKEVTE